MISHRPIVFVDVETTGLSARDGFVVEIGALRVEKGEVVGRMSQLLDPGVDLPWYITKITGIKAEDLKGQPQFRDVSAEFNKLMDGAIFAAHNVDFDYSFMTQEYKRAGSPVHYDRFCTAKLSRRLTPQHRRHGLDSIIKRGGYEVDKRHRAFDDAEVLYKFFADRLGEYGYDLFDHIEKLLVKSRFKPQTPAPTYVPFFK